MEDCACAERHQTAGVLPNRWGNLEVYDTLQHEWSLVTEGANRDALRHIATCLTRRIRRP